MEVTQVFKVVGEGAQANQILGLTKKYQLRGGGCSVVVLRAKNGDEVTDALGDQMEKSNCSCQAFSACLSWVTLVWAMTAPSPKGVTFILNQRCCSAQ